MARELLAELGVPHLEVTLYRRRRGAPFRRCAAVSLACHAGIAMVAMLDAAAAPHADPPIVVFDIDTRNRAQESVPTKAHVVTAAPRSALPTGAPPSHARTIAPARVMTPSAADTPPEAPAAATTTSATSTLLDADGGAPRDTGHPCEGNDCVLEGIDRCRSGDGEGCVAVGRYYERGRRDPFSAIKWYVRGCGLGSAAACESNERVKDTPVPGSR